MAPIPQFDPSDLTRRARRDLLRHLEGVPGKKNLVIEKGLGGIVDLVVKYSTLREYGTEQVFYLEVGNIDTSQRNIVFVARGEKPQKVQAVAEQIKRVRQISQSDHEFTICWVPRRTLVSDQILEAEGVLGDISVLELPIYFLPLEKDLLSLQLEESFGDLYLRKDPNSIFLIAKALMLFQQSYGLFPRIISKGENARRLVDLLTRMRAEAAAGGYDNSNSVVLGSKPSTVIEDVIVIDREIDPATPLLTQLTYEGLVDEIFTIANNQVEASTAILGTAQPSQPQNQSSSSNSQPNTPRPSSAPLKRKVALDNNDPLFAQLRDTNFALVGTLLNKVARRLQSEYETQRTSGTSKTTAELRDFVSKLPGYQAEQASLKIHTSLAEEIMKQTRDDLWSRVLEVQQNLVAGADPTSLHDTIEELISRNAPLTTILRLLCLESVITNGLRQKDLEHFQRLVLHAYGHQHLLTFSRLEKMGLLTPRTGGPLSIPTTFSNTSGSTSSSHTSITPQTNYLSLRRSLRLVVDVDEHSPEDIAYAYSGYAPLSIRILQTVLLKRYMATLTRASAGVLQQAKVAEEGVAASLGVKAGFKPFEDAVKSAKGPSVEVEQGREGKEGREKERARTVLKGSGGALGGKGEERVTLVVFAGGVTYAEVAAVRFVSGQLEKEGRGRRVVVCTTGMVSGERMMEAAVEGRGFRG
ncbi:MAG: hypothetical protein M1820_006790 [Bogoriella megaspora]|nr:MAG: hypothetical protein M1820_006790 [Bogoriella megaspora]